MGQAQTRKRKNEKLTNIEFKEKHFIQNGAILLQKRIALTKSQDIGEQQVKLFSANDIEKAANSFNSDLIVARSQDVTVYKGALDDRIVAIKFPRVLKPNSELLDHFLTEASTEMVMNRTNIIQLYGCCLDTCVPILVYEFLPNGILFEHLHGSTTFSKKLKWADQLRVAADVSYALSYMHNAFPKPVVHRDVHSHIILLDDSLDAKLTNFGYSVAITPGETSERWPVQGTPEYIDPEYIETEEVTCKCDVYSFGVLMLELLTGKHPLMMANGGENLIDAFVAAVERNCMMEMTDKRILGQASWDGLQRVAQLALACVRKKGEERPTMIEVVSELWFIEAL